MMSLGGVRRLTHHYPRPHLPAGKILQSVLGNAISDTRSCRFGDAHLQALQSPQLPKWAPTLPKRRRESLFSPWTKNCLTIGLQVIAKHHMKALLYRKSSYEAVETLLQLAENAEIAAASQAEIDDSASSIGPKQSKSGGASVG